MVTKSHEPQSDRWAEWLLQHRHGGNAAYQAVVRREVELFADRVLTAANLRPGMTLLDVGSGDGLLAFRAIERLGAAVHVFVTDISAPLLHHAEIVATRLNIQSQCTFVECSAEALTAIADSSIDAVLARAAIAYVQGKRAAFNECFRVLKSGGCLSIAESILQDEAFAARALRKRIETATGAPHDRFLTLLHRWKAAQYPDTEEAMATSSHANFSERDLFQWIRSAGFCDIHLQLCIDVVPALSTSWEIFLGTSPHPLAPTLATIMAEQFSPDDRLFFESIVRPTVESGKNVSIDRVAYVNAKKP